MFHFLDSPTSDSCTLSSIHRELTGKLIASNNNTASLDARLLICAACNISYEQFIAYPEQKITSDQAILLNSYVKKRLSGEPVSRIFGTREFWSHSFALNNDTLDPRPDTETLVSFVLELLEKRSHKKDQLRILDLGTGSGCVILSLLSELSSASGVGIDISLNALKAAKKNAQNLKLQDRVDFIQGDWLEGLSGSFDVIVSNPPYIPTESITELMPEVRCYDPVLALDGGPDGLDAYRKIIKQTQEYITGDTWIVFEIGAGQEIDIKNLLMSYNTQETFSNISYKCDLKGIVRCIATELKK